MSTSPQKPQRNVALDDIDRGVSLVREVQHPDAVDALANEKLRRHRLENDVVVARIKSLDADREMRGNYAKRILRYLEVYSAIVGLIVITSGFKLLGFTLPVEILATLVGSTAAAAIGLVGFIARGLFQPPKSE